MIEKEVSYGDLIDWVEAGTLAAICSIGTAGILNRCSNYIW